MLKHENFTVIVVFRILFQLIDTNTSTRIDNIKIWYDMRKGKDRIRSYISYWPSSSEHDLNFRLLIYLWTIEILTFLYFNDTDFKNFSGIMFQTWGSRKSPFLSPKKDRGTNYQPEIKNIITEILFVNLSLLWQLN